LTKVATFRNTVFSKIPSSANTSTLLPSRRPRTRRPNPNPPVTDRHDPITKSPGRQTGSPVYAASLRKSRHLRVLGHAKRSASIRTNH
jgi:hypothetical protein